MNELTKVDVSNLVDTTKYKEVQDFFKNLSARNRSLRSSETPKIIVKKRQGKAGQEYNYITRKDCHEWLDEHYPIWSANLIPDSFKDSFGRANAIVKLEIVTETGFTRTFTCVGSKEYIYSKGELVELDYHKMAETDALKRCCVTAGAFQDVYSEDIPLANIINNSDEQKELAKQIVTELIPLAVKAAEDEENPTTYAHILSLINKEFSYFLDESTVKQYIKSLKENY